MNSTNSQYKIGIFGSAEGDFSKVVSKAHALGRELGKHKVILITGASTGLPYEVILAAKKYGAKLWGFSPTTSLKNQQKLFPDCNSSIYDKLFYIPKDYEFISNPEICKKYRNVTSTANCNAGIIISGRWGTLNEFTNLHDMGKVIGILTGTDGIADELPSLTQKISKKSKAKVLFSNSPKELVIKLINELKLRY